MIFFRIGQTISSGRWRSTAISIASPVSTTSTSTVWPSSVSAICARWLRLLWAETRKRMRSGLADRCTGASPRSGFGPRRRAAVRLVASVTLR